MSNYFRVSSRIFRYIPLIRLGWKICLHWVLIRQMKSLLNKSHAKQFVTSMSQTIHQHFELIQLLISISRHTFAQISQRQFSYPWKFHDGIFISNKNWSTANLVDCLFDVLMRVGRVDFREWIIARSVDQWVDDGLDGWMVGWDVASPTYISERDPIDKSNLASYDWAGIELSLLLW